MAKELSVDLAARKVIVAAYLYYVLDGPTMSDAKFDELSRFVADHWEELSELRQWQLGSPDELRASGGHIRFTVASVHAARQAYIEYYRRYPSVGPPADWKEHTIGGFPYRYVTAVA